MIKNFVICFFLLFHNNLAVSKTTISLEYLLEKSNEIQTTLINEGTNLIGCRSGYCFSYVAYIYTDYKSNENIDNTSNFLSNCNLEIGSRYLLFSKKIDDQYIANACFKIIPGTYYRHHSSFKMDQGLVILDFSQDLSHYFPDGVNAEIVKYEVCDKTDDCFLYKEEKVFKLQELLEYIDKLKP